MLTFLKNFYADYVELFLKWQTNRLKNHMDSEEEEKRRLIKNKTIKQRRLQHRKLVA